MDSDNQNKTSTNKILDDFPFISIDKSEGGHKFIVFPERVNKIQEKENTRKEFNTSFASLQNWFIRIAHKEKLTFVLKLLEIFTISSNTNVLIDIMDPITKDLLYVKTQFTHTKYDITPLDHNRCLTTIPLAEAQNDSITWFSELYEKEQIHVMLILLQLSGSAITFHFYMQAVKHLEKKTNEFSDIEQRLMNFKFVQCLLDPEKTSIKIIKSTKNSKALPEKHNEKGGASSTVRNTGAASIKSDEATKISYMYDKNLREWEKQFSELLDKAKLFEDKNAKIESTPNSVIDMLQLLPISVNRRIYSFLDFKSRKHLRAVNEYWFKSYIEINKEENTRNIIRRYLNLSELQLNKYKRQLWELKVDYVNPKLPINYSLSETESSDMNRSRKKNTKKRSLSLPPLDLENFTPKKIIEMIPAPDFKYPKKFSKDPYKEKYTISRIYSRFDHTKCIAANNKWIAVSDDYKITLHGLLTGAPNPCQLEGHNGYITVLHFHQSKSYLFSGSCDTTIKYWDIYSRRVITTYSEHDSIITALSANENYLASGSMDKKLRIFCIKSGNMMWVYKLCTIPTAVAIGDKIYVYSGLSNGTVFKTKVKYYEDAKPNEILVAHAGKVTCMLLDKPFLITGGCDGYVRVWHHEFFDTAAIATLDHKGLYISSVALSFMKIFTTADDGILRIWDIYDSSLKREIVVNISRRPILSMILLEIYDHTKIVINSEDGLKVLEFHYHWIKLKKNCLLRNNKEPRYIRSLTRIITTKPDEFLSKFQYKKIPKEEYKARCLERSLLRHAALPTIVNPSKEDIVTLKEVPVVSRAVAGKCKLLLFPRILPKSQSTIPSAPKKELLKEITDGGTNVRPAQWKYFPRSSKGVLPACNPSKRTI